MKDKIIISIIAILVTIIIVVLTQYYNREFPLQYLIDGEIKTEVYHNPKECNARANYLRDQGYKVWL